MSRPEKRVLQQRGILRERVFNCDLAEHLLNTGSESNLKNVLYKRLHHYFTRPRTCMFIFYFSSNYSKDMRGVH